jgi:hypothetical protein
MRKGAFGLGQLGCQGPVTAARADRDRRRWEPKRLRLRIFAVAGRLVRGGRRLRPRLAERWPWADEISAAVARLQGLTSG